VKYIGYVIVIDSHPVKHWDSDPYWLQFSSYCELYPTYAEARKDVRKELRRIAAVRGKPGASKRMLDRWTETIRIIPVKRQSDISGD
jgi:hypothetical protein